MKHRDRLSLTLLGVVLAALLASGIRPYDRLTWMLEVAPFVIALPILLMTARRFPLTPLVLTLIAIHALILILGAYYTYARVPLGEWARHAFDLARNNYDRLGHFAQGFIPAMVAREILLRCTPLKQGGWLFTLVSSVCLAISAAFELCEWTAALLLGGSADAYLAMQGDVWDTQWDMFMALVGAITAQLTLGGLHDRQLARLRGAAR